MDYQTREALERMLEQLGEAAAKMSAAPAVALIRKGELTADEILKNYNSPSGGSFLAIANLTFITEIRAAKRDDHSPE